MHSFWRFPQRATGLEYVDWANPILQESLKIVDGHAFIPEVPGSGINWDEAAVERYLVE